MIKLSVDDFDQGREPRADTLDINQPKESPPRAQRPAARGYYLALTFGTLLSSQGADAHEPRPSGLRSKRLSMLRLAEHRSLPLGVRSAGLPARSAQRRHFIILCPRADSPSGVVGLPGVTATPARAFPSFSGPGHTGVPAQRPRNFSIPTVRPGCRPISRTASSTPGMKEARS